MLTRSLARRCCTLLLLQAVLLLPSGCDWLTSQDDLAALKARGELVLITRNNVACYYEGPHGPSGFEHDLARRFAQFLGVELRIEVIETEADMIAALKDGRGDVMATGSPIGSISAKRLSLGPGYLEVTQQVVGHRGGPEISDAADLSGYTLWMTGSSARMDDFRALHQRVPDVDVQVLSAYSSEDLLQMVWKRALPLAVVDSNLMSMTHHDYPELVVLMPLGPPRQLRWATDPNDRKLAAAITAWFSRSDTRESVGGLVEHYYSHLQAFDYVDLARYRRRVRTRLPKYRPYFERAAGKFQLDWKLVAAQAYQESHWDPRATSYTGVRGIMMLTLETAAAMALEDRMDPEASIFAGTRYLAGLHRRLSKTIPEPDRTFMALAAYNIGFGHLQDARALAKRLGKHENSWYSVRSVLPLLQQKKYYATLTHRYARGKEAVTYVDRIRTYYRMLEPILDAQERKTTRPFPPH
jgi:membrane-bound lytic murein transglycosylase F